MLTIRSPVVGSRGSTTNSFSSRETAIKWETNLIAGWGSWPATWGPRSRSSWRIRKRIGWIRELPKPLVTPFWVSEPFSPIKFHSKFAEKKFKPSFIFAQKIFSWRRLRSSLSSSEKTLLDWQPISLEDHRRPSLKMCDTPSSNKSSLTLDRWW